MHDNIIRWQIERQSANTAKSMPIWGKPKFHALYRKHFSENRIISEILT